MPFMGTFLPPKLNVYFPGDTHERFLIKVHHKVSRDVIVIDHCRDCSLKGEFFSAKNWEEGSTFAVVPFGSIGF